MTRETRTGKSVLIIGEDPAAIDFDAPDAPAGMSAAKIMDGLNAAKARLEAGGHTVALLLTRDADTVEAQTTSALSEAAYDVVVVGAGLRTLPSLALQFERLMNVLHVKAPRVKLAFNTRPDDSDAAALRWL